MELNPFQVCRRGEGWVPVKVASATSENMSYLVLVNPFGNPRENICECSGYVYRGQCRHQEEAMESVCYWTEKNPRYAQTEAQRTNNVCPRCGGPTKWELEVIE
jgi:hypothetical protein